MGISGSSQVGIKTGVCTSTTRPSSPYAGQVIFETDTFTVRTWDGTAWVGIVPSGSLQPFAGATAPNGWLMCFGQAISRTTYADLFAAIGTTHGVGNGSTTFNVPDLRGRTIAGKDNMGGSAANRLTSGNSGVTGTTLGAVGGDERMHGHNHDVQILGKSTPNQPYPMEGLAAGNSNHKHYNYTSETVGSGASQNVQPTIVLNYIIKV